MKMSLSVLKHLGLNLYSNMSAVLSEVVANAYDADATEVNIDIEGNKVVIQDNGNGMSLEEINAKFLMVGYSKRENNEAYSKVLNRPVMGRKGIGKLSLFSIAKNIEIYTNNGIERHGLLLNSDDIEQQIKRNNEYNPKDIEQIPDDLPMGTRLILSDFKKNVNHTESFLKKRIARRFSIISEHHKFTVKINGNAIGIDDRDYFKKIQFLWTIGEPSDNFDDFTFEKVNRLNGSIDNGEGYKINGWIGAVEKPSDLDQDGSTNNKISILCRGKLAQEDILASFNEGGIYSAYLIGEIHADFLDLDDLDDIATSSRQSINEDDPRYRALISHVYSLLKSIQNNWASLRTEAAQRVAVKKAEELSPVLAEWFNSLGSASRQNHARKLFATIESLHFMPSEEKEKKKELYRHGILAFEKLKLKESLNELDKLKTPSDFKLASIFNDLTDIEASQYYDIASGRVEVIKQFQKHIDANDKEKLLQQYLFDNLWLLNPSWERSTAANDIMEQRVEKEFQKVFDNLSEEERNGRLDIKYRTAAGTHVIVELKRYSPSYSISGFTLAEQINKYKSALSKCLTSSLNGESFNIQCFVVIGNTLKGEDWETACKVLHSVDARLLQYDYLIHESLQSYEDYLTRQKAVGKVRDIVNQI